MNPEKSLSEEMDEIISKISPEDLKKIPQQDGWFRVEDCLPANHTPVLIYCNGYIQVAEYWYDEGALHIFMDPPHPPFEDVTHWQPLPEPPRFK